ncbi:MAG: PKD domain-containing protein, partial [Ferruginibacter sp.]
MRTTNGATYTWNFGTGATSSNANPTYTYTQQGNYAVSLTATGSNGCSASLNRNQFVTIQLPVVGIRELPQRGCAPFEWQFEHVVYGGDPIATYHWDFGDGTTSTQQSPTHVFDSGTYNIQLSIVTTAGCTDTVKDLDGI